MKRIAGVSLGAMVATSLTVGGCSCGTDGLFSTASGTATSTGPGGGGGDGGAGATATASVTGTTATTTTGAGGSANSTPTVTLPADGNVLIDATVPLAGVVADADGDPLTLTWLQLAGAAVTIASPGVNPTSFVASVPLGEALTFQLEACDPSFACASDSVTLTVTNVLDTYVAKPPVGDDAAGDGSQALPWATVGKGVSVGAGVIAGTIIANVHVQAGVYDENIVMVDGVSVLGGYAADWTRDRVANPTTIRANNAQGLLYGAGGVYTRPTDLDGVIVELEPAGILSPVVAALTIEEGFPVVRDTIVRLATGASGSLGVSVNVPAGGSTDVLLNGVTIEGGDVTDPNGTVIGLAIGGQGVQKTVTAIGVAVDLPMTTKRNAYGVDVDGGGLTIDASSVTIAPANAAAVIGIDEVCGVRARNGASVTGTSLTVAPGAGFRDMRGICASNGSSLTLTGSTIGGGDPSAPAALSSTSAALLLDVDASATVGSTTLTGGKVSLAAIAGDHRSYGVLGLVRADLRLTDSVVDAGPGDWGIGVRLLDPSVAVLRNTQVNTSGNLTACSNARRCVGLWVEGRDGPVGPLQSPQMAPYSCCDPLLHGVVVEGGRIVGGSGSESTALLVTASSTQQPGACANGAVLDAGDCPPGNLSAGCRGVDVTTAADFLLHNSTVYGGTGIITTGARVVAGTATPQLANNYIHGGDPAPGMIASTSTGLFFVNGKQGTGWRVINNIIDGGTGATRWGAFEENHNADPGRFQNNDVVMAGVGGGVKSVLYRNCTPMACTQELNLVSEINTLLTGAGQTTFGQGGTISSPGCMVDPDPRTGDPHQAAGSPCIDAGLERNQSCNICQTPWSDAFGVDRLSQGWTAVPAPCTQNGPLMTGDAAPDIGPGED